MTCKELTQKYIADGQDSMRAFWWARNPSNPESPSYNKAEADKTDAIMTELASKITR